MTNTCISKFFPKLLPTLALPLTLAALPAQNTGVTFDPNVDGYIEVPYSAQVVPQSGITFEAWITYDDSTLPPGWRYPTIARQGPTNAGAFNYMLRVNADNVGARVLSWWIADSAGTWLTISWTFAPGQLQTWTHVAATYDGASSNLYVDGVSVASAVGSGLPLQNPGNEVLRIGKGSDVATPIEVWNGEIDEVRLWPFARTAEDIQRTMNMELSAVPGYVSTWNLNNNFVDTSGAEHGTSSGLVTFTANPLALTQPVLAFGIQQGASTPGCDGDLKLSMSGPSEVSYNDYRVVCTRAPANTLTLWGASGSTLPGPLPLLGIDVWVSPLNLIVISGMSDALGTSSFNLPIPANVSGFTFAMQCVALDSRRPMRN